MIELWCCNPTCRARLVISLGRQHDRVRAIRTMAEEAGWVNDPELDRTSYLCQRCQRNLA